MSQQLAEADRRIENLIFVGKVVDVDPGAGKARVKAGDLVTPLIPWVADKAMATNTWFPLEEGETVLVASPSGDVATAVIIGALPTGQTPPYGAAGTLRITDESGSFVEFKGGDITIEAAGTLFLKGAQVRIN
ncbi:phage baseplate assembly protein V [Epibacterium ulvae]|uniref:phage baseplate assembly protein V n=1 Tax=Epibacterium ulvae TaxID=1156985 RepID=UPI0024912EF4|nr:phage baseplate assembly protein V [Epibacterium ulvae]